LAQILAARDGSVLLLGRPDRDLLDPRRRIWDRTCFRRPLAKVCPLRLIIAEAMGHRFMHHVNDARSRDESETGNRRLFGAVQNGARLLDSWWVINGKFKRET